MKNKKVVLVICCILVLIALVAGVMLRSANSSPYEQLRRDGYLGTEEQLLASLVGELVSSNFAYDMACGLHYRESVEVWAQTLTGREAQTPEKAVFSQMRENGYEGSLADWLESLIPEPERLGHSDYKEATEYELACQYGFEGSFAQWLISLVGYKEK